MTNVCVVLVYFLTLRNSIFFFKSWRVIGIDVSTKHHVIKEERAQTVQSDTVEKLPSVEITLLRDIVDFVNKTSRDKGGTYSNEKWKPCNWILSDITPGRNYPT